MPSPTSLPINWDNEAHSQVSYTRTHTAETWPCLLMVLEGSTQRRSGRQWARAPRAFSCRLRARACRAWEEDWLVCGAPPRIEMRKRKGKLHSAWEGEEALLSWTPTAIMIMTISSLCSTIWGGEVIWEALRRLWNGKSGSYIIFNG